MPATLVHPAAILPVHYLAKGRLPLSALVIGSLSPDFEYLLRWGAGNRFAHTLPGLAFCVPAGLLALWLFHAVVKRPLLELAPEWHRRTLAPMAGAFRWLPWARLPLIAASVAIGALSHMALDSFTHYGGWAVQAFPAFKQTLFSIGHMKVTVYSLLQYLGTLLGLVALAVCHWLWVLRAPAPAEPRSDVLCARGRWALRAGIVLVSLGLGVAVGLVNQGTNTGAWGIRLLVAGTALGSHTGLYAACLAYGAGFTLWQWRRKAAGNKIPAGGGEEEQQT